MWVEINREPLALCRAPYSRPHVHWGRGALALSLLVAHAVICRYRLQADCAGAAADGHHLRLPNPPLGRHLTTARLALQ